MGRFGSSTSLSSKPAFVVPVIGLMDTMNRPPVLANDQAVKALEGIASDGFASLPEALRKFRSDLHFFIHSNGGFMDMLKEYRRLIASVTEGGGKVYSHVPLRAGSAAALLALDADQCFTTSGARFMFHSVAPCKVVDKWMVTPCEDSPFGMRLDLDPLITPLPPTESDRAQHDAWVDQILGQASHGDRNAVVVLRQRLRQILKHPDNERGEFVADGGTLASVVSTVRPFNTTREMRRHAEKKTSFPSQREEKVRLLWENLHQFQA